MATSEPTKETDTKPEIKSNDNKQEPNDFLTSLKLLIDTRATNLLVTIVSKIIQDPNDKRRQFRRYIDISIF